MSISFNSLRMNSFRHVVRLQKENKVTPGDFRFVVLNPERHLEEMDRKNICSTASIQEMLEILSVKKYLNWQNYDLLVEIIKEYGNSDLEGELEDYRKEIVEFENKTLLSNITNVIFTPSGDRYYIKAPVPGRISRPTLSTARKIQNGLKNRNGFHYPIHHVGQNSPLAIFFIVPRLLVPPTAIVKSSTEKIEDRVIWTLSEEDVLQLIDVSSPWHLVHTHARTHSLLRNSLPHIFYPLCVQLPVPSADSNSLTPAQSCHSM